MSFETILHITSFIINYANIHGLPSPGILLIKLIFIYKYIKNFLSLGRSFRDDTMAIIFLPVSDSYIGLYRIYDSSLDVNSEHNISH